MKRRRFKQLTRADRLNIEKYLRQGMTKQAVADALGVSLRTVYYELKRGQYIHTNSDLTEEVRYSCDVAESVKKYNGTNKGPQLKIGDDHELAAYIERADRGRRLFAGGGPWRNPRQGNEVQDVDL